MIDSINLFFQVAVWCLVVMAAANVAVVWLLYHFWRRLINEYIDHLKGKP